MKQPAVTKIAVLIPAYQPADQLVPLLKELVAAGFVHLVVVNDGSAERCQPVFDQVASIEQVELLYHEENQGKGAAIKTGLKYLLKHHADLVGVITADADGQHLVKDILAIADALLAHSDHLVLGERQFGDDVPLRSRFGNVLTKKLFGWIYRSKIQDTQTGLRGFSLPLAEKFLQVSYDGYEFEFECLIEAINNKVKITNVPIETVYIEGNISSHFRPVIDSVKIYYVFFRYAVIALLSFFIDLAIFVALEKTTHNILLSLFIARACSSSFNFTHNKFVVYKSKDKKKIKHEIIKYLLLAFLIFCWSYILLSVFHLVFHVGIIWSKIIADIILFCISFIIQRYFVFHH